jgi:hypothetical protein
VESWIREAANKAMGSGITTFGGSVFAPTYQGGVNLVSASVGGQTYNASALVSR